MKKISNLFVAAIAVVCLFAGWGTAHATDNWTGAYLGVNATYALHSSFVANRDDSGMSAVKPTGWVGGAQLGYQYQFANNLVLGAEADYQFIRADGSGDSKLVCPASVCGADVSERDRVDVESVGTVRARLGYAKGKYLPYVTAGYAYGHAEGLAKFNAVIPTVIQGINATGWIAGAGLDYRIAKSWSARAEYDYLALSEDKMHFRANVVRVGLNYHF